MRYLYSLGMILLTPVLLLRLWWKGRRLPAYRRRIAERFVLKPLKTTDVWVHAVSLGEVVAVTPLIEALLNKKKQVLVTTMTPTGSAQVQKQFGQRVAHQYLPYDLPGVLTRFYKQLKPKVGLIMETELWPNMIHYAKSAEIPLYLINARLSDEAFSQYKKAAFFFKPILEQFDGIFTQSIDDGQRFIALGAPKSVVKTLGNLKFDGQRAKIDKQKFQSIKQGLGERTILIAASTHQGEEKQILAILPKLQSAIPNLLLLIAPRHPERFHEVFKQSLDAGFCTGLRSQEASLKPENAVVILDSMGELLNFYGISDYAFVGGSLVPIGGHNVLEPIAADIPVFCGMHMQNSKSICSELKTAEALEMVEDADSLANAIIRVHQDADLKKSLVANANKVLQANQGVLERYLQAIKIM